MDPVELEQHKRSLFALLSNPTGNKKLDQELHSITETVHTVCLEMDKERAADDKAEAVRERRASFKVITGRPVS